MNDEERQASELNSTGGRETETSHPEVEPGESVELSADIADFQQPEGKLESEHDFKADPGVESGISTEEAEWTELTNDELNEVIENICNSKAEEFRMLGYEYVTGKEVWECVSGKYEKLGTPPLHRIVNDILSLKVTQFMNWLTMNIYKSNPFT